MALKKLSLKYPFRDNKLNVVLQDYKKKINEIVDYFLDSDFGNLALYDTDKSDVLNLKWNENDSNPRDLNFRVNKGNRTINLSGNLTVEGASLINSDLTTDANWATSGSITAGSLIIDGDTLDTNEWAFLDGQDQAVKTTDAPGFATGVTIGKLTLADGSITESDGAISFGNENLDTSGYIALKSNAELRFYDNGNYVGFEAPALGADCIWVLPDADGAAGEHMVSDGSKNLSWTTGAGTGDVSAAANMTDHTIVRGNGGAKGVQDSGIVIDDSDRILGNVTIAKAAADCLVYIDTYDTSPGDFSQLYLRTSDHDTMGTLSETQDGDFLGRIIFNGVDNTSAFDWGARIFAIQNGAGGVRVPTDLILETYSATAENDNQLVLHHDGGVGIGTDSPGTYGLYVQGNMQVRQNGEAAILLIHEDAGTHDAKLRLKRGAADWYFGMVGGNALDFQYETDVWMTLGTTGNLTLTSASSTITGGAALYLEAGITGLKSVTVKDHTTGSSANVNINSTTSEFRRCNSALKYKEKVKDLELDPSLIYQFRPVSFNSLCKSDDKKKRFHGLIADEVERILPAIATYGENNEVESYDDRMLMTLMLAESQNQHKEQQRQDKEIQEQEKKIEKLQQEVKELKEIVNELR